jgi:protein-tyrosine-phosphatase/DNA-binding transcriptional ArsR family regulator
MSEMLERRAAIHAALADTIRLRIVDALQLEDLSPGELSRRLSLSTNLLAHHVGVLESAGVVRRSRSEGDRRRSYVSLRADAPGPALLGAAPSLDELRGRERVVFVCTHNSARSQLAASAWQRVSMRPVASAGTHPGDRVHPGAVRTARRHGLSLVGASTAHVDDVLAPEDLVVAVCDQVVEELPFRPHLHWSVPDPVRTGAATDFEVAFVDIVRRVDRLAATLDPGPLEETP